MCKLIVIYAPNHRRYVSLKGHGHVLVEIYFSVSMFAIFMPPFEEMRAYRFATVCPTVLFWVP